MVERQRMERAASAFRQFESGATAALFDNARVSDASTPLLMAELHRRLSSAEAEGPLDALVAAKRALRRTHPLPFHWAPFVLLGDPR